MSWICDFQLFCFTHFSDIFYLIFYSGVLLHLFIKFFMDLLVLDVVHLWLRVSFRIVVIWGSNLDLKFRIFLLFPSIFPFFEWAETFDARESFHSERVWEAARSHVWLAGKVSHSYISKVVFQIKIRLHHCVSCDEIFETKSHLDVFCEKYFLMRNNFYWSWTTVPAI